MMLMEVVLIFSLTLGHPRILGDAKYGHYARKDLFADDIDLDDRDG